MDPLGLLGDVIDDTLSRALGRLQPHQRQGLVDQQPTLAVLARQATPEQCERAVTSRVQALQSEADREARLERQRRATRLRTWVDRSTGMWWLRGEFDPVTGLAVHQLLEGEVARRFADSVPETAPDDPVERSQHLMAHAFVGLVTQPHCGAAARPEVIVTLRPCADGTVQPDWVLPVELPRSVLAELVAHPDSVITPDCGGRRQGRPRSRPVASGALDAARQPSTTTRAAGGSLHLCDSGCEVRFSRCNIHHITWWRHGGATDLDKRPHPAVHSPPHQGASGRGHNRRSVPTLTRSPDVASPDDGAIGQTLRR